LFYGRIANGAPMKRAGNLDMIIDKWKNIRKQFIISI